MPYLGGSNPSAAEIAKQPLPITQINTPLQ
jgi:hypothetical protein